jgi:hypothetical protein
MGAPIANQFWKLRSKDGKDKMFKSPEVLWKAACGYFEYIDNNPIETHQNLGTKNVNKVKLIRPYTIKGLCIYLDCNEETLSNYGRKDSYKDYFGVVRKIKDIIYTQKFEGAAVGLFHHNIIARDLGLVEKQQTQQEGEIIVKVIRE